MIYYCLWEEQSLLHLFFKIIIFIVFFIIIRSFTTYTYLVPLFHTTNWFILFPWLLLLYYTLGNLHLLNFWHFRSLSTTFIYFSFLWCFWYIIIYWLFFNFRGISCIYQSYYILILNFIYFQLFLFLLQIRCLFLILIFQSFLLPHNIIQPLLSFCLWLFLLLF